MVASRTGSTWSVVSSGTALGAVISRASIAGSAANSGSVLGRISPRIGRPAGRMPVEGSGWLFGRRAS